MGEVGGLRGLQRGDVEEGLDGHGGWAAVDGQRWMDSGGLECNRRRGKMGVGCGDTGFVLYCCTVVLYTACGVVFGLKFGW